MPEFCAAKASREELELTAPDREDELDPSQEKRLRLERVGMRIEPLALPTDLAEVDWGMSGVPLLWEEGIEEA